MQKKCRRPGTEAQTTKVKTQCRNGDQGLVRQLSKFSLSLIEINGGHPLKPKTVDRNTAVLPAKAAQVTKYQILSEYLAVLRAVGMSLFILNTSAWSDAWLGPAT